MKELYFITSYFNPFGFKSRLANFKTFYESLSEITNKIYVVEAIFPEGNEDGFVAAPQLSLAHNYKVVTVKSLLWHKESLLNIALRNLPESCKYVSWLDADIIFDDKKIVKKIKKKLNKHNMVQCFSDVHQYDPNGSVYMKSTSYVYQYIHGSKPKEKGYRTFPEIGFAWAVRRELLEELGGFFDYIIFGANDTFMSLSAIDLKAFEKFLGYWNYSKKFEKFLRLKSQEWQEVIKGDVGYVNGKIYHLWHGSRINRRYAERDQILAQLDYRPFRDVKRNEDGILEWVDNQPLQKVVKKVLYGRKEDSNINEDIHY